MMRWVRMGEVASLPFLALRWKQERLVVDVGNCHSDSRTDGDVELAQSAPQGARRHPLSEAKGVGLCVEKGLPEGCPSSCCFYTELNPEKTLCG